MEDESSWSSEDTFSEYYNSLGGQIEYFLMCFCLAAMRKNSRNQPPFWYGAQNAMHLYLIHASYSPFVDAPWSHKKQSSSWNMTEVPEGQEHLVDENFLPRKINRNPRFV